MDIHVLPGTKVVYTYPDNGYPDDQRHARSLLWLNQTYTISRTYIGSCHTDVEFTEHPGELFNSVLFEDIP